MTVPEDRRVAQRREADEIARRREDSILVHPAAAAKLVDCEVCGGTGAMTARPANEPAATPALLPCPACGGRGATLHRSPLIAGVPSA
jgi:DnaJ-class molecular chaperone